MTNAKYLFPYLINNLFEIHDIMSYIQSIRKAKCSLYYR